MLEIDHQPRIKLADLRQLFTNCKKLREYVEEKSKKAALPYDQDFDLRREAIDKCREYFRRSLSFGDWKTLQVEAEILTETIEIIGFVFEWETEGKQYRQRVSVEARPSNLGLPEPVYYFVCPYRGRICRKLFFDGYSLASRYAFPHTYSKRNYSHRWRDFERIIRGSLYLDDMGSHRKEIYRGQITAHGKKMSKLYGYATDSGKLHHILTDSKRGRPRKDGQRC